jgi:hypothetical protein
LLNQRPRVIRPAAVQKRIRGSIEMMKMHRGKPVAKLVRRNLLYGRIGRVQRVDRSIIG